MFPTDGDCSDGRYTLVIECKGLLSIGISRTLVRNRVGVGITGGTINSMLPHNSQLMEQANNARMVVGPLWPGPDNIHGFALEGKSYRQGWATNHIPTAFAVSGVRMTTST